MARASLACEPGCMSSPETQALVAAIAARIRSLRTRSDLSQEVVAEKAGLPVETISRAENARMVPSLGTLLALAGALGVGLADIVDPGRPLPPPVLTSDEHELLAAWRSAIPGGRRALLELLKELGGR